MIYTAKIKTPNPHVGEFGEFGDLGEMEESKFIVFSNSK
jgi:hypothetical protein